MLNIFWITEKWLKIYFKEKIRSHIEPMDSYRVIVFMCCKLKGDFTSLANPGGDVGPHFLKILKDSPSACVVLQLI